MNELTDDAIKAIRLILRILAVHRIYLNLSAYRIRQAFI